MNRITRAFFLALTLANVAHASRVYSNSLTDCINKADIIVVGVAWSFEDAGDDVGVMKFTVMSSYKGPLKNQDDIVVADRYFHSGQPVTAEGPVGIKPHDAVILFLKAAPDAQGRYVLFDSIDGVVRPSPPINAEIYRHFHPRVVAVAPRRDRLRPLWICGTLLAMAPGWWIYKRMRRNKRLRENRCLKFGYDLRATPGRCPECGAERAGTPSAAPSS